MATKYKLLNILFSDDGYIPPLPANNIRLAPKPTNSPRAPTEKVEVKPGTGDEDVDLIDLSGTKTGEKSDKNTDVKPTITMPDDSQTINLSNSNIFDWSNPINRDRILDTQIYHESRGNPNAVGLAGEKGIAQFMPGTWKWAMNKGWVPKGANPVDVTMSVQAQYRFMDYLMNRPEVQEAETSEEQLKRALTAYNAGLGNLQKALRKAEKTGRYWMEFIPSTTKTYITRILTSIEKNKDNYKPKYGRSHLYT